MSASISRHTLTDTRQLILGKARELLLTHSYRGLNFQELADQVGIRKASLYHHFASKGAVGLAVVEDSHQRFRQWCEQRRSEPAARQLQAYLRMFRDQIGAGSKVCAIAATVSEWDCIEPALQDAVARFHRSQLDWLAGVVRQLPDSGNGAGRDVAAAEQWAALINAGCQGALINARLRADPTAFDAAVAPLIATLNLLR